MLSRFLLLAAVLAVPVLLAVASQAMTRPPGPPTLPTAPIDVSFAPAPAPTATSATPGTSAAPTAGPTAGPATTPPAGKPDVVRQPRPTADDDDFGDDDGPDDVDD